MPEIPDLSKFAKDGAEPDGKVVLSDDERETLAAMATAEDKTEPEAPKAFEVTTAYVIFIGVDGSTRITDYDGTALALRRPYGNVDVISSTAFINADMVSNLTAAKTQQAIIQLSAAAAEQAAQAQIQAKLARGGLGFPPGR